MSAFTKLIDSVRSSNPDLITEQQAKQLINEYNEQLQEAKKAAISEGFADGYKEGARAKAIELQSKMDSTITKLDKQSTAKLKNIMEMIDKQHSKKLLQVQEALRNKFERQRELALEAQDADYAKKFKIAVDALNKKHQRVISQELRKQDEQHSKKLVEMYNKIDHEHAQMITEAVKTIDQNHAKKLTKIADVYKKNKAKAVRVVAQQVLRDSKVKMKRQRLALESKLQRSTRALKNERQKNLNVVAQSVQKYLNYALDKHIPTRQLISEAKYNAALKTIQKVTDVLKVNAIVQESKDGIFADYEAKIAEQGKAQENLIKQNVQLKARLDKKEAQIVLEQKCRQCTPSEAKFVRSYFHNATSPKIIEESINEARAAFKKLQSEKRSLMVEEAKKKAESNPAKVVVESTKRQVKKESAPKKQIVSEEKVAPKRPAKMQTPIAQIYATMLRGSK